MSEKLKSPLRTRINDAYTQLQGEDQSVPTVGTVKDILREYQNLSWNRKISDLTFGPGDIPKQKEIGCTTLAIGAIEVVFIVSVILLSFYFIPEWSGSGNAAESAQNMWLFILTYATALFIALASISTGTIIKSVKKYRQSKKELNALNQAFVEYLEDSMAINDTLTDESEEDEEMTTATLRVRK